MYRETSATPVFRGEQVSRDNRGTRRGIHVCACMYVCLCTILVVVVVVVVIVESCFLWGHVVSRRSDYSHPRFEGWKMEIIGIVSSARDQILRSWDLSKLIEFWGIKIINRFMYGIFLNRRHMNNNYISWKLIFKYMKNNCAIIIYWNFKSFIIFIKQL